jgi:hypothetical protein
MAIDKVYFNDYLAPLLLGGVGAPLRIACLSYPDILLPPESIIERFPSVDRAVLQVRQDSEKICAWHGIKPAISVTETSTFFTALGHSVDVLDVAAFRGPEVIVDLNCPLPDNFKRAYDLVIDTGTLEHCFNVGVAFQNMCSLVKTGGQIITASPMTKINHGFWNFSPCAYENFFCQNGWELLYLEALYKNRHELKKFRPSANGRFLAPPESSMICSVRRTEHSTINFPTQAKYM